MRTFVIRVALLVLPIVLVLPIGVSGGEPQPSTEAGNPELESLLPAATPAAPSRELLGDFLNHGVDRNTKPIFDSTKKLTGHTLNARDTQAEGAPACCEEEQSECKAAATETTAEVPACESCDSNCPIHKLGKLDTSVHHLKHAHARQIAPVVKATIFQCLAAKLSGDGQPHSVSVVLIPTSSDDTLVAICPREHASLVKESIEACDVARHYVVKAQVFEVAGNGETVPVGRSSLIVGREGSVQCVSSTGETVTLSLKVGESAVSAAGAEAASPNENVSVSQKDFDAERCPSECCESPKAEVAAACDDKCSQCDGAKCECTDPIRCAIEREAAAKSGVQQELANLVEEYNRLARQKRWSEAELIGKQAKELDPYNPVAIVMFEKARICRQCESEQQSRVHCPSCGCEWVPSECAANSGQAAPSQAAGASATSEESGTGTPAGHSESEESSGSFTPAPKCDAQEVSSACPAPQCDEQTSSGAVPTTQCEAHQSCPCHNGECGLKIVLSADGISFGPHAAAPWVTVQIPGLEHLLASHQKAAAASGCCHSADPEQAGEDPATEISKLECTAPGHTVINDADIVVKAEPAAGCTICSGNCSSNSLWIVPILPANALGSVPQADGSALQPGIDVSPRPVNEVFAPHDRASSGFGRLIVEIPKPAACGDSIPAHASGLIVVDGPDRVRIFEKAPAAECEILPAAPAACPACKDEFGTFLEELLRSSDPAGITQVGKVDIETIGSDSVRELPSLSPAKIETTVVTYPLSDLVLLDEEGHPVFDTCTFIDHLQSAVAPDTWSHPSVSIQLNEQSLSLVIRQTPEVHKQIESHLHYLRRLQVKQLCHLLERMSSELHSRSN